MIERFLEIMFSGFWAFMGCFLLAAFLVQSFLNFWTRLWRFIIMIKYGYPPDHCDADGDFKKLGK